MTRPVQHRSCTLTQTADGNWSWWGKQRRCTHACTFCGHIWMQGSAHMYTLREWESVRPCVCVVRVCLLTATDAHCSLDRGWSSYWWQYGAYRGGDLLGGPFSLCAAENSWMSSTSPHVLSWRSLQLEASPIYAVSNQAVVLPLLHYHMNGCHIAIYCMAIVGKSLKIIGSYMVG